jgi:hypothetical protein
LFIGVRYINEFTKPFKQPPDEPVLRIVVTKPMRNRVSVRCALYPAKSMLCIKKHPLIQAVTKLNQVLFNLMIKLKAMKFQLVTGQPGATDYLVLTTTFTCRDIFYKAALAETISWEGQQTGSYDVLLQSGKGTKRLTLLKEADRWRAGEEIEQIGVIEQQVVDMLGEIITEARSLN